MGTKTPQGHQNRQFDQRQANRSAGQTNTPARGQLSNPGNVEAGVGHTRGHNRPGTNTGGRGRDAAD